VTARLNLAALPRLPLGVRRPDYDFLNLSIGMVHLGIGAFHRAHQAVYTEEAIHRRGGEWGILGVALRHPEVPNALAAQDQLYCVETLGTESDYRVIAAVRASLSAPTQRSQVLSALSSGRTHVISLTITEKGYCLGRDGGLDFTHPDIVHDLQHPSEPKSAVGWLAAGLHERFTSHRRSISIMSCDNLEANGARLGQAVRAFVERTHPSMLPWLREATSFPQTVVDCIVPAASDISRARVRQALGVEDLACVQREPYSQWIIEDRFAAPRPAWEEGGAQMVEDVADYGRLKLHVLNTCHSALAYLGLPRGYTFVREAVADTELAAFLDQLVEVEIAPALEPLPVVAYWRSVRTRFANLRIDHRLAQIAVDGVLKLAERVYPLMIANAKKGAPLGRLARIVHAWLALSPVNIEVALDDPLLLPPAIRGNMVLRTSIAEALP
jgi:fructuronate reductase